MAAHAARRRRWKPTEKVECLVVGLVCVVVLSSNDGSHLSGHWIVTIRLSPLTINLQRCKHRRVHHHGYGGRQPRNNSTMARPRARSGRTICTMVRLRTRIRTETDPRLADSHAHILQCVMKGKAEGKCAALDQWLKPGSWEFNTPGMHRAASQKHLCGPDSRYSSVESKRQYRPQFDPKNPS